MEQITKDLINKRLLVVGPNGHVLETMIDEISPSGEHVRFGGGNDVHAIALGWRSVLNLPEILEVLEEKQS